MPENNGDPITSATVFDKFSIDVGTAGTLEGTAGYLYSEGLRVGSVRTRRIAGHRLFDPTNPEVIEVQRRLDSGEVPLHFERNQWFAPFETHPWIGLQDTLWYLATVYPFHERGVDPHHFFDGLSKGSDFIPANAKMPQRFIVPGIVDSASRRYYKRDDNAGTPDIRSLNELAGQGWTADIPYGSHELHAIDVLDTPQGVNVSSVQRIYNRRKDLDAAIRSVARKWHEYWTGLTTSEQAINTRMTLQSHVQRAIGRAWNDKPYSSGIRVFHEGDTGATARHARDSEDWMLGNLEQWAHEWGFEAMATALAEGGNRANLNTELADYTFCLIKQDGAVGDRLANPNVGISEETWNGYFSTDYNAALGTLISVVTSADFTVHVSESFAILESTVNVVNPSGATTYQWEQVSGDSVTIINPTAATAGFSAPAFEAGDDATVYTFKVTVTNNGESASDTITVTVQPPAAPEE